MTRDGQAPFPRKAGRNRKHDVPRARYNLIRCLVEGPSFRGFDDEEPVWGEGRGGEAKGAGRPSETLRKGR
jgi:hypothetical protein